jgi:GT2 family glycosyltransferase
MHSGSIERLVNKMEHSNVGIVAPMLIFPSDTELYNNGFSAADFVQIRPAGKVQHVGIETNINGEFYHIFVGWSVDNPKVRRMFKPYAVTGACLMTRRSIWTKTNGFDMVYGQGTWEDVDYCMKVRSMGYDIELESGAVGTHYVNASAYKYRLPMPLNENRNIFMSRWGNMIEYTEWRHL